MDKDDLAFLEPVESLVSGVVLSDTFIMNFGIANYVPVVRRAFPTGMIVLNYRLVEPDDDVAHVVSDVGSIEGITLMGYLAPETILVAVKKFNQGIYAVVDGRTQDISMAFSDSNVPRYAILAKKCGCRGVLMTTRFLRRIQEVRKAVGEGFTIIAMNDGPTEEGQGILAGADYESVDRDFWANANGVKNLEVLTDKL